jgi:Tol biopolymer transport system component
MVVLSTIAGVFIAAQGVQAVSRRTQPEEPLSAAAHTPLGDTAIAFSRGRPGKFSNIFVARGDEGRVRQLTFGAGFKFDPAWSPDGTRIAYTYDPPNPRSSSTIFVADVRGGRPVDLRRTSGLPSLSDPAWASDGRLAYIGPSPRSMWGTLYVARSDGSDPMAVTPRSCEARSPSWSPDGKSIALTCGRNQNTQLHVVDLETKRLVRLRRTQWSESFPAWAPSGDRIAFSSLPVRAAYEQVSVMRARPGSQAQLLTRSPVAAGSGPAWSPDSQWIAFNCGDVKRFGICVMRSDGTSFELVLRSAQYPAFRPNVAGGTNTPSPSPS